MSKDWAEVIVGTRERNGEGIRALIDFLESLRKMDDDDGASGPIIIVLRRINDYGDLARIGRNQVNAHKMLVALHIFRGHALDLLLSGGAIMMGDSPCGSSESDFRLEIIYSPNPEMSYDHQVRISRTVMMDSISALIGEILPDSRVMWEV